MFKKNNMAEKTLNNQPQESGDEFKFEEKKVMGWTNRDRQDLLDLYSMQRMSEPEFAERNNGKSFFEVYGKTYQELNGRRNTYMSTVKMTDAEKQLLPVLQRKKTDAQAEKTGAEWRPIDAMELEELEARAKIGEEKPRPRFTSF